ncbi:Uncharacterized protein containing a TIR (Toll-Interleukin 1-resistance) domain [Serratia fonticola]|uniref:Uncharacterized protein containing a TIR (Toll-Interleukin 1-resistance) domain n=1 Tax=Serratia fonticola TaxID=47917 RepID=A0A3S4X1F5_SERFO|nr:Uncharacterized protein containing a TIR (Toll-Interleukin 1-resistance) domain [Serratia fonticola]
MSVTRDFDIALSFAGEDREYVQQVANLLIQSGVKVFYDSFEEANLWGKDLYSYLNEIYKDKALYTIMFISEHYSKKLWTNHERKAMQARAFQESAEYILPAKFDSTEIPGVLPTTGFISLVDRTPENLVKIIHKKLVNSGRTIPSESLRKSFFSTNPLPKIEPLLLRVIIKSSTGELIPSASIVAIADNNTIKQGTTDASGCLTLEILTRRNYSILVAHPNFPGAIIIKCDPAEDIEIILSPTETISSVIINSTGYIKGLEGRLSPILDNIGRTYLYADNIAINGGKGQPVYFGINTPITLEDCNGVIIEANFLHIQGNTSLIQYYHPRK